jgi:hypothetical protein
MQEVSKYCPKGLNILKVDKSLPHVLNPNISKLLEALAEAEIKSGALNRMKPEEFKILSKLTFTDDHQAGLYVTNVSKPHNRYSDILPCNCYVT